MFDHFRSFSEGYAWSPPILSSVAPSAWAPVLLAWVLVLLA